MPKILVALDGTPGSAKALETAVRLAQSNGGQIAAVTVLERPSDPHLNRLAEDYKVESQRRLQEVLQAADNFARSRGVRLTPLFREGHPADAILACAEQEGAELLILGSRGDSAAQAGLGATADQVSGHCPCTVMLVK